MQCKVHAYTTVVAICSYHNYVHKNQCIHTYNTITLIYCTIGSFFKIKIKEVYNNDTVQTSTIKKCFTYVAVDCYKFRQTIKQHVFSLIQTISHKGTHIQLQVMLLLMPSTMALKHCLPTQ